MFEGRPRDSCLVSTLFAMPSHNETQWSFPISKKCSLLNSDETVLHNNRKKKICKRTEFLNLDGGEDDECSASNNENNGEENGSSDSDSLIPGMNKDDSISCLLRCSRADYCSIASVSRTLRNLIRTGEIYRLRSLQGTLEHWVYFSCHLNEWEAFDPRSKRWMRLPSMPQNECFRCADKESLAVGTDLLVFGWEVSSYVIYRYSLLTNSWSTGKSMNMPRCLFASASYGEVAFLAGGCDSNGRILDTVEMYNYEDQTWSVLPEMNKRRKMCSGVFMDGKFYVFGGIGVGEGNEPKVLTCGEEFDLKTRKWREIPDLSPPRSSNRGHGLSAAAAMAPPLVAVVNDQLYAADHAGMAVRRYDKEKRVWIKIGSLPEQAGSMNGWGLAFRACGDQVIVIGGPKAPGEGFIELNSWVPIDGTLQWHLLGKKQSVNFVYNCTVMSC